MALMWILYKPMTSEHMHALLTIIQNWSNVAGHNEQHKHLWTAIMLLKLEKHSKQSSVFVVQPTAPLQCIKDLSLFVPLLSGEAILAKLASRHTTQYLSLTVSVLKRAAATLTTNSSQQLLQDNKDFWTQWLMSEEHRLSSTLNIHPTRIISFTNTHTRAGFYHAHA